MKVVIVGGHGFIGHQLAHQLMAVGALIDRHGNSQDIGELILVDQIEPDSSMDGVTSIIGDIVEPGFLDKAIDEDVSSIFHLAATVSAAAEADFDLGMRVNLDATRALLERCRSLQVTPRLVFSSSVAAFGYAPAMIEDDTPALPLSSYGVQKVIGEYLASEYARRGYVDSRCLRLPTVVIRPGKPNKAASSFVSSILREPLQGEQAVCPVDEELSLWIQSPRLVIKNLLHAHNLPSESWAGGPRVLNLPGLTVTVREMIEALKRAGGDASLIRWEANSDIKRLIGSWPGAMNTVRANAMGFKRDENIDRIIQDYVETVLEGAGCLAAD